MVFDNVLAEFKKGEAAEDIIALVGNEELQRLLVAWPKIILKSVDVDKPAPCDGNERWQWLWLHVRWSEVSLTETAGIPTAKYARLFNQAKGCRLIYPDGAISAYAKKYLSTVALLATARLKTEIAFAVERAQKERK